MCIEQLDWRSSVERGRTDIGVLLLICSTVQKSAKIGDWAWHLLVPRSSWILTCRLFDLLFDTLTTMSATQDIRVKFVIQRGDILYEKEGLCIYCPSTHTIQNAFTTLVEDGVANKWKALGLWKDGEELEMTGILYDDEKTPTHTNYDAPLTSTYRTSFSRILVKVATKEEIIDISSDDEAAIQDGIEPVGGGPNASEAENPNQLSKKKKKSKQKSKQKASEWDLRLMRTAKRSKKYREDAKIFGPRTANDNLPKDMKPGSVKQEQEYNRRLYCCHEGDTPRSVATKPTKLNLFEDNDSDPIGRLVYDNRSKHHGLKPDTSMKEGAIFVIPLPPATQQEI